MWFSGLKVWSLGRLKGHLGWQDVAVVLLFMLAVVVTRATSTTFDISHEAQSQLF